MPLTNTIHDSLLYIDSEPTAAERAAAQNLIELELGSQPFDKHPSLLPLLPPNYTTAMNLEFERISNKDTLKAIDRTRYEALEPPATSPHSDERSPETLELWRLALKRAYISQAYLTQRQTNLGLLERYGKNGWLIGNSQLEDMLKSLEREFAERKTEIDGVVMVRKNAQESVLAEIKGLEEGWRSGVGRVLETEVAAEGVRTEILQRRREGAR